jgi:MFS family permease
MASELDGAHLYGPLDAAAQAPMFLMMPVGAWLLSRFKVGHLMLLFTVVTVAGAVLCAAAPSMEVFIAGTAVRAFAAGALATIGMGAISRGLPQKYRQLVLAAMSGVWVLSSVLGPVYAVSISSLLGWRWAMLLYLPLLLLARMMIARYMPERTEDVAREKAPWGWSIVLATGSAVLSLPLGTWSVVAMLVGGGVILWATTALLPSGTFRASDGRRAALSALMMTAAVYFGASMVLSVVAHDAFGLDAREFGFIIAAPGFMWAIAGLWTGSHPALGDGAFRRRALPASIMIALGVAVLFVTTLVGGASSAFAGLFLGAVLLGLGMGSLYPDLLGRCLSQPAVSDGISEDRMAAAVVLSESVGLAVATTFAFAWLGAGLGLVDDPVRRAQLLYLALVPLAVVMIYRLVAAGRSVDGI